MDNIVKMSYPGGAVDEAPIKAVCASDGGMKELWGKDQRPGTALKVQSWGALEQVFLLILPPPPPEVMRCLRKREEGEKH